MKLKSRILSSSDSTHFVLRFVERLIISNQDRIFKLPCVLSRALFLVSAEELVLKRAITAWQSQRHQYHGVRVSEELVGVCYVFASFKGHLWDIWPCFRCFGGGFYRNPKGPKEPNNLALWLRIVVI